MILFPLISPGIISHPLKYKKQIKTYLLLYSSSVTSSNQTVSPFSRPVMATCTKWASALAHPLPPIKNTIHTSCLYVFYISL